MPTITETRLRDAATHNVKVIVKGCAARLTLIQPCFDAEGRFRGEAHVTVEGKRRFGGTVEFSEPLAVTITGAPPGEDAEFERMARYAVEALANATPAPGGP